MKMMKKKKKKKNRNMFHCYQPPLSLTTFSFLLLLYASVSRYIWWTVDSGWWQILFSFSWSCPFPLLYLKLTANTRLGIPDLSVLVLGYLIVTSVVIGMGIRETVKTIICNNNYVFLSSGEPGVSLIDCFRKYTLPEKLLIDEQVQCSKCKIYQESTKQVDSLICDSLFLYW